MAFNIWPWNKSHKPKTTGILTSENRSEETPQYNGVADKKHWDKILFAFRSGNKNYFCFSHDINIPYERMNAALDIYRELDAAISPVFLQSHIAAVESILASDKIKSANKKLLEIGILNSRLKERKDLTISIQLSIKLATVKYFDETENPFGYQHDYNQRKMEYWMQNSDVPAFFLNLPENQYLASGPELQKSLKDFLQGESLMNLKMLEHHFSVLQSEDTNPDLQKTLDLQKEQEELFLKWSNVPAMITT